MRKIEESAITKITETGSKLRFNYALNGPNCTRMVVCRKVFAEAYGFTLYEFKSAVKQFRRSDESSSSVPSKPFKVWKDDHLHDFSFNDVLRMGVENHIDLEAEQIRCAYVVLLLLHSLQMFLTGAASCLRATCILSLGSRNISIR
jgi:hypothetical protein